MYDNVSNIYNCLLANYEQQYSDFSDEKKKCKWSKHTFSDLFLDDKECDSYFDGKLKAVGEELTTTRRWLRKIS